ncbi:hypothetical protein LWI29_026464 [Acer saccharum]|uniref:Brf1 TBP-binding domain-containing protein n=1 Tax=Acer saccharum TaxID=4024 RepID=A0AA39W8T2_ACESA|nr:hypothetical protein LWI29_026464 [Acer saccharum]
MGIKKIVYASDCLVSAHNRRDDRIMDVPDVDDADNFSDSDAFEIDDNLLNEDQKHYKNIIQEVLKWQYFKDRAEKEAMFAAAKEAYEQLKADRKIDVTASNSGNEQAAKEAAAAAAKEAYKDLNVAQEIDVATSNSGKEQAAKEATDAAAKEAYYEDLNVIQENDVAASNSGKEMQQKRAAAAVYAEAVYAEAVYPASAESASEVTLRFLMLAKKRMSVCNYCYNAHAGYHVTHVETVHYLCETCYHRDFTDRHIYSVAKIKQNGQLDDSFSENSWEELIKEWDDHIEDVPDGDDADNFFDSDAFEIDDDLLDEDEKHYKNIIQAALKWLYFKDRAEKEEAAAAAKEAYEQLKAVLEIDVAAWPASNSVKEQAAKETAAAAAKEAYEDLNAFQENDVAASNSGKESQQKRAAEAGYPTSAESTSEATLRMLAKKRLSSKINDDVLEEVYNDLVASENNNTKRRESDNNGNKRRESQDTFEIGELELEGYFDSGESVRRRGIWKPNGLRKCSRKLSS